MCSSLVHIVFNILLIGGLGLTIAAFFSPGWIKITAKDPQGTDVTEWKGLFQCNGKTIEADKSTCDDVWKNLNDWEKVTFGCLLIAIAVCTLALVWSLLLCCCLCCFKSCLAHPLPVLVALACVLDIVGIAVYAANQKDLKLNMPTSWTDAKKDMGYSIYAGIAAIIVLFVDTIVGAILVKIDGISPI